MQFKVPQDVQREDRIVGPLTLRQLIICGVGFSISYAIYTFLGRDYELITALIPVILIALVTIIFAFVKPLDLAFERYILFWIESMLLPAKRYWLKGTADPSRMLYVPAQAAATKIKKIDPALEKKKQSIEEITKILDKKYQ